MRNKKAEEEFKSFLKNEKHRITPERFEVMDYAMEYDGHFGADELYIQMKIAKSNISRATIYNTLELLASCEMLAKRNFGDGVTRYESSYNRKNHDHLICTNCGSIKEFSSAKIQKIVDEISAELGFDSTGYSFNVFGKCLNHKNCKHAKNDE